MSPLVSRLPDIDQTHGGVKPVEHGQRQSEVAQHRPQHSAVELGAVVAADGLTLDLEGLGDPHGDVAHDEEGDQLAAGLAQTQGARVAAAPQPVNDERRLQ